MHRVEKELLSIVHGYILLISMCMEGKLLPKQITCTSSSRRLQRVLLQLQRYHLKVVYKSGNELLIADTLSRAYLLNEPTPEKNKSDVLSVRQ